MTFTPCREKKNRLYSVKCENVETHKQHSLPAEIEKRGGLRSVKCDDVWTHKQHLPTVEIEKGRGLHSVNMTTLELINDTHSL